MAYHPTTLRALRTYQSLHKPDLSPYPVADAAEDYASALEFQASEPAGLYAPVLELMKRSTRRKAADLLARCRAARHAMSGAGWCGEGPCMDLAAAQAELWKARSFRAAYYLAAADHAIAAIESALELPAVEAEPDPLCAPCESADSAAVEAARRCGWRYSVADGGWVALDQDAYPDECYSTAAELCDGEGIDVPREAFAVRFTVRNDNPDTIWNRLAERLGRDPTHAEASAEVKRILRVARA